MGRILPGQASTPIAQAPWYSRGFGRHKESYAEALAIGSLHCSAEKSNTNLAGACSLVIWRPGGGPGYQPNYFCCQFTIGHTSQKRESETGRRTDEAV